MKKHLLLYVLMSFILGNLAGGITSVDALEHVGAAQESSNTIVPNVTGIPSDVALQILQMAGLAAKIQRGPGHSLIVDKQEPGAGALVAQGSEVLLAVGNAEPEQPVEPLGVAAPERTQGVLVAGSEAEQTILSQQQPVTVQQPSILYAPNVASPEVQPKMAWYPKRFLTKAQPDSSTLSLFSTQQPAGYSNIFQAKPLQIFSNKNIPIIMAPTFGWQHGWIPYAAYTPYTQTQSSSQAESSSALSIQSAPTGSVTRSVEVPAVFRLLRTDAEIAFQKAGLAIGNLTLVEDYHLRSGIVLRQFPAAKTLVPVGSKVDLWIVK